MAIWFKNFTVADLNHRGQGTLSENLGICFTELGEDYVVGTMPVEHRTKQPAGLLHGGASVALAETLASTGANLTLDFAKKLAVGLEINANHVHSCTEGLVVGKASPIHIGRSTQLWEIKIHQADRLICISRITLAVIERRAQ